MLNSRQIAESLECRDSTELVPGDIFVIGRGMKLPCDGIMLVGNVSVATHIFVCCNSGINVPCDHQALVDESMMTGESKPVYKTALPYVTPSSTAAENILFNFKQHHKHVLYGGSEIQDSGHPGGPALCLVAKTGFSTEQVRAASIIIKYICVYVRHFLFVICGNNHCVRGLTKRPQRSITVILLIGIATAEVIFFFDSTLFVLYIDNWA